ncbi:MAG: hypothetical protein ACE1Y4_06100 [Lysobacterales bacterium]
MNGQINNEPQALRYWSARSEHLPVNRGESSPYYCGQFIKPVPGGWEVLKCHYDPGYENWQPPTQNESVFEILSDEYISECCTVYKTESELYDNIGVANWAA